LSNYKKKVVEFLRFCVVGAMNAAVDFTVFFLLTLSGVPYLLAQVLSYSAGVVNSYFLNRKWTFQVKRKANRSEVFKVIVVNSISLLVTFGLLFLLHDAAHVNLWLSKLAATGGGMIVNFMGSRLWVFKEIETTRGEQI
jgi:putative flippase GtrA